MKKTQKKKICNFEECKSKQSLIGNCKWCNKNYCLKHRLPESHLCIGLDKLDKFSNISTRLIIKSVANLADCESQYESSLS